MYPWKGALSSWAESTKLQIDALGLITILGVEEVNTSVGRLVSSRYVEFLPLLGAFVLAGNHFVKKQPNFCLYNLTEGVVTTELSGWFSRWLKAQDFHQIHHRIYWEAKEPQLVAARPWTPLVVGLACNGLIIALTVLSADWWGFANVLSMITSVAVRTVLLRQNKLGIDRIIDAKLKGDDENNSRLAKVIVVTDESKVISMKIPRMLVGCVFTQTPRIPHPGIYTFSRWVGWVAFGIQIISLGMASLLTQICIVVLIVLSTILTAGKFGCDDWRIRTSMSGNSASQEQSSETKDHVEIRCRISSALSAVYSEYPDCDDGWFGGNKGHGVQANHNQRMNETQRSLQFDVESQRVSANHRDSERPRRRQDLFSWMSLSESELKVMMTWNLLPDPQNKAWWRDFEEKRQRQSAVRARTSEEVSRTQN